MGTLLAWLVHAYTASSVLLGLWAVHAIYAHEFRLTIYLMIMALAIDCTDGLWARRVDVRRRIPWLDGRRLDDICDFFTYVVVPALMMMEAGLLPHPLWVCAPVLASAYGFSQEDAKTPDCFFLGFPSYWNVVAMYLYLLGSSPRVSLAIVLVLSVAVFVPLRYIYPTRSPVLRGLSMSVAVLWAFLFSWAAVQTEPSRAWIWLTLILGPGYYLGLSLVLHLPPVYSAYRPAKMDSRPPRL